MQILTATSMLAVFVFTAALEVAETRADPQLNSWSDAQGAENGDKCA